MPLAVGLGDRNALHAVDAAFVLEAGIRTAAADGEGTFLHAAQLGLLGVYRFHPEAAALGMAAVHADKVSREKAAFLAARAAAHLDDDAAVIVRVAGKQQDAKLIFHFGLFRHEGVQLLQSKGSQIRVGAQGMRICDGAKKQLVLLPGVHLRLQGGHFLQVRLISRRVHDDLRLHDGLRKLLVAPGDPVKFVEHYSLASTILGMCW